MTAQSQLAPDADQVAAWWATEPHFVMALAGCVVLAGVIALLYRQQVKANEKAIERERVLAETLKDSCHVLETICGKSDDNTNRITEEVRREADGTRKTILHRIDLIAKK